ncbi:hypothetical protein ACHQM5_018757 [Ranunculus cassubicifolius]
MKGWLCTTNTKNMLVKIVHPGGHVELHDRPLLAAEIMLRNPRCCVAHPHVFKEPWAIIPPDTMLPLGQKFYVVPISTIRKLQTLSLKRSSSSPSPRSQGGDQSLDDHNDSKACCLFSSQKPRNNDDNDDDCLFLACLLAGMKSKDERGQSLEVSSEETSSGLSSERKEPNRKRSRDSSNLKERKGIVGDSPKRRSSFESWQPSLTSIVEE